jgi:hypothetical protein
MSGLLYDRWASKHHVGGAKPVCRVMVRSGKFVRNYTAWNAKKGSAAYVNAKIYGEKPSKPWNAVWHPTGAFNPIPNIARVEISQDFDNNGIAVATITIDNVVMVTQHNPFNQVYHLIDRGYMSPFRGSTGPATGRVPTPGPNEWYSILAKNVQLQIYMGYGEDTLTPVWTGLIDDVDLSASPTTIEVTARDFGQALTDQDAFGHAVSPQLPEPIVFRSLGVGADGSEGTGVGVDASASSTRSGHPPRFVVDTDAKTAWYSHDHTTPDNTEWVQVRLPRGRYESFAIHTTQPGMEMFCGIYARSNGLGGEPCSVDDNPIDDGWVSPQEMEDPKLGGENVPGGNGGWAYIKHWNTVSDKGHTNTFSGSFQLGDDSVLRIGFRNLYKVTDKVYRAGVVRLAGVKRTDANPVKLITVGKDAEASTTRPKGTSENFHASNVLDNKRDTRWLSHDHSTADNTEWIQIRLPAGRYESVRIDPEYAGMDVYLGVYARQGKRKHKCEVNGTPVEDGWVRPSEVNNGTAGNEVPGGNGGWPYVNLIEDLKVGDSAQKLRLNARFDLGEDSVIRVGFRDLFKIGENYRAGVNTLKAYTRTGADQEEDSPKTKVIQVGDLSDVVKVVLRWAGFKEWDIEPVGAPLKGRTSFNRANTLMDIIKKAQEATGYVFHIAPPSGAENSIGVPTFRSNQSITDAPAGMPLITDQDMLTDVQVKATDEPLFYIIRVRGKVSDKYGKTLGGQTQKRVMAVYRPPWTRADKLAGLLKHVTHTEGKLQHTSQCMVMAELIALQEALVSAAAEVEIPGIPNFDLNYQVGLLDTSTGLNTRLFIARRSTTFEAGANARWTTTLGGALIDTDDIKGVIADLRATLKSMGLNPDQINLGDPFGSKTK